MFRKTKTNSVLRTGVNMDNENKDNEQSEQKPFNHPDYEVAPGIFNFAKWSRENIPKPPHKFKVGDVVVITITTEVVATGFDCDGTPLYNLGMLGFGWSEDGMRLATDEEADNY